MKRLVLKYLVFILGLFFLSLGVVLIVRSSLGTTPISCLTYVVSINSHLTLGTVTFLFNILLIALQLLLISGRGSRKDRVEIMLQIPFSFLFAAFIDLHMFIFSAVRAENYWGSLAILFAGLVSQAVGVVLELKPDVSIMSAEGFVKYASRRYGKEFGKMKVWFDVGLVSSAVLVSLALAGRIDGVREGTFIAAIFTGYAVTFLSRRVFTGRTLQRLHLHS